MNAEVANDVDPKYLLKPRSIIDLQVRVGDVWLGTMWACVLTFVWLRGKIHAGEWFNEVVGSCRVQKVARLGFLLPRNLIKTCTCDQILN